MRCSCGKENPPSATRCEGCGKPLSRLDLWRLVVDAAAIAGLILALALIYLWDRNHAAEAGSAPPPTPLRLAVTPREYDDMGKLLDTLGRGYQHQDIPHDDLLDPARLAEFDVVFLTCGGVPTPWVGMRVGESERDGAGMFQARPDIVRKLHDSLREYVGKGGTLYVSDLQFQLLELAFPEFIDSHNVAEGAVQMVHAEVVDPGLQRRLGQTIQLRFDKVAWRPAAFRGPGVVTCLRGEYDLTNGVRTNGPLLVQFPFKEGTVIFTSFHNEKQNSRTELELLRYLVFASVTAREGAKADRLLVHGGFSPAERNLLSATHGGEPVTQEYQCRGGGSLEFVLAFQKHGAKLRLSVVGPDGTREEGTGEETFQIEIPNAAKGTWKYTVTPIEIPYPNFPFSLAIGEKRWM